MQFSKTTIVKAMKMAMSAIEKAKKSDIELALAMCLDDLSTRFQSRSFLHTYDEDVAADDRTIQMTGEADDLQYIFALKYGTGDDQTIMEYVDPTIFMKSYDNPNASAGTPSKFTILTSTDGYPNIKLDVPAESATTITVYYFLDINDANMVMARSAAAITAGALGWFHGIGEERGAPYYSRYKELVGQMRASDHYLPKEPAQFKMSIEDQNIRDTAKNISRRRS